MHQHTTRRTFLGGLAAAGSAALAGCSGATPFVGQQLSETETVAPEGAESIAITGDVGDVSVRTSDRDDVDLDLEKQSSSIRTDLDDLVLRTEADGENLALRSEYEGSVGWFESRPSMSINAEIPGELAVSEIETDVGRVTVRDVAGDLSVRATTGRVDVDGVDGAVEAQTTTGRVTVRDMEALGDVRTTTGRIEVDVPAIDGETTIRATTGRIEAAISSDVNAEIRASTTTGRIDTDDLAMSGANRTDGQVTGTLGEGGPTLRFETTTGRITLTTLSE
ncbi:DUF4097 domain-containing protein [Halobacteria archaeon AArc-dxtr1]|nr:DUF4097 domain-containing protein [Halobacteria archaeon AArc-dxtr1]